LIELLVTMTIVAALLGLSARPLRHFWLVQSLEGATDAAVTQLREQQEDSVSQAYPRIFGARFTAGSAEWTLFRYDPNAVAPAPTCTSESRSFAGGTFGGNVIVKSVAVTNDSAAAEYTNCASAGDKVIFFYPRGSSTGGSIVLEQPNIGLEETVSVSVATGRVTRT
jgi:type II secretory pathway pseudopilin PulG